MHDIGVQELSLPHETGQCGVLESVISKALTDMSCHVKSQVSAQPLKRIDTNALVIQIHHSINDKDFKKPDDIAALVGACIGTTKAQSTLAVRIHIAFLIGFDVLNSTPC